MQPRIQPPPHALAPTRTRRPRLTKLLLPLSPARQLPTIIPRIRQRGARRSKVPAAKILSKTAFQAPAPGIVREARQRAVLVRVELARVGHAAHAVLVAHEVVLQERLSLFLRERGLDVGAVFALGAVVAVADGLVAADGVVV